jgi:predicted nucleotide-binding protein
MKNELSSLTALPWSNIEAWVAKATPVVRHDWPEHLKAFQRTAAKPKWCVPFGIAHIGSAASASHNDHVVRDENARRAEAGKRSLLNFLDGLIAIGQPDIAAPSEKGRSSEREDGRKVDPRKVFVVHGRNNTARTAMFEFLRSLQLHPLQWGEVVKETGEASPYTGRVLEVGFAITQATVVLMTPDDEARLCDPFRGADEPEHETRLTGQPRQNVLVEAGMALGMCATRTVLVEMGQLRPASDLFGRYVVRMDNSVDKRNDLVERLRTAGCAVNTAGSDWIRTGNFEAALAVAGSAQESRITAPPEYVSRKGVDWKKDPDGSYVPCCPKCKMPLSKIPSWSPDFLKCTICKWHAPIHPNEIDAICASLADEVSVA